MNWMNYHIAEEYFIGLICLILAYRSFHTLRFQSSGQGLRNRLFLVGSAFILLGINNIIHSTVHLFDLNQNLLYQTLLGYCIGLLTLIVAISSERPWRFKYFPFFYVFFLFFLIPEIHEKFPIFGEFRPLVWIIVSYLSGIICMLYIASYYRTRNKKYIFPSLGHAFICASAIFLFFPASIGSTIWVSGHLIRPFGFIILFFSLNHEELISLRGSILYRTLAAFSLLASIPLFMFGMVISYDNITPVPLFSRKIIVFLLLLVTLSSALIFSLGLIIRLIHPILFLKNSVDRLIDEGFNQRIQVKNFDEIGELSQAFNDMVIKLRESTLERDRLSRFAATGELAATLAHEIKNPLNAIAGAAKYLEKNFHTPLIKEFAKIIFDEVMRINALTQNLLDFAKPIHAELKQADLNELVLETIRLLGQEFKDQNTSIETELAENIPIIKFDYNHIKQLLINLIINSLDAIKEEGRIKIMTVSQNGKIFLSVEDNGQGIPQKDLEKIFNPFFTTKTRGSGLGLAISQKIAKEHGGDLFVSLNQKERTKISLVLPI